MALPAGWLGHDHNFLGIEEPWCHPQQAGVYVLPAPYEHTSSYVLGSDRGPSAILEASRQVELYDETVRGEPYRDWGGIATAAALDLDGQVDAAAVQAIQNFVQPHVGAGRFLVTLTGEHTGALGAIRAHASGYPTMCVVQIDAHGDLRNAYLDPSGPYEGRAARWIPEVVQACTGPVYLTFDCDGLDASLVPALGTPEPGGLGWYDTLALITALANGPGIVGMDISEIAPIDGFVAPQFSIARLIYRMLGRIRAGHRVH